MSEAAGSVFARLGGEAGVARILDRLYAQVMEDDHLREYFFDVDLEQLKESQLHFLRVAFGDAGAVYDGPALHVAHKVLLVSELAFDMFVDLFVSAAAEAGVDADSQTAARAILKSMRASVITEFKPNPAYNYPTRPR
jgi:hemoglobin